MELNINSVLIGSTRGQWHRARMHGPHAPCDVYFKTKGGPLAVRDVAYRHNPRGTLIASFLVKSWWQRLLLNILVANQATTVVIHTD